MDKHTGRDREHSKNNNIKQDNDYNLPIRPNKRNSCVSCTPTNRKFSGPTLNFFLISVKKKFPNARCTDTGWIFFSDVVYFRGFSLFNKDGSFLLLAVGGDGNLITQM